MGSAGRMKAGYLKIRSSSTDNPQENKRYKEPHLKEQIVTIRRLTINNAERGINTQSFL
jgi:hypothetical protein